MTVSRYWKVLIALWLCALLAAAAGAVGAAASASTARGEQDEEMPGRVFLFRESGLVCVLHVTDKGWGGVHTSALSCVPSILVDEPAPAPEAPSGGEAASDEVGV